jgi:hypothetical protein
MITAALENSGTDGVVVGCVVGEPVGVAVWVGVAVGAVVGVGVDEVGIAQFHVRVEGEVIANDATVVDPEAGTLPVPVQPEQL